MRAANSHPSYQDLSVAAYELLQRLHHLLPVLRLLEVGVARSVGFLQTKRTKRVFFPPLLAQPGRSRFSQVTPGFFTAAAQPPRVLTPRGLGFADRALEEEQQIRFAASTWLGRSHLFRWRAASCFKCITRGHWIFPVFCALHANPQRLVQPDIRVPD